MLPQFDAAVFELTLEQDLELEQLRRESQEWSREQLQVDLLAATRLLMVKENVTRRLLKS